jgi:hypothetical protein
MILDFMFALPPWGSATMFLHIGHSTFVVAPSKVISSCLQLEQRTFMNLCFDFTMIER